MSVVIIVGSGGGHGNIKRLNELEPKMTADQRTKAESLLEAFNADCQDLIAEIEAQ